MSLSDPRPPFLQFVQAPLQESVLGPVPAVAGQLITKIFRAIDFALIEDELPEIAV
jgi:hypothetical protein